VVLDSERTHRWKPCRRLGARAITALSFPIASGLADSAAEHEKAHNLKEKSLEVVRIYRGLVQEDASRPESQFAFYLDEAALVTLGVVLRARASLRGGVHHPILRRLKGFREPLRRGTQRT